jgi:hypothetical protein
MLFHRASAILALALGVVGVAGCAAAAYGVWLVASRLHRANDQVFDAIDRGLGSVQDRLPLVQQRVRDSKITTAEITEAVGAWTAKKVQDRIVSQLEIESRTEKLSAQLQAAELRLDASTEVVLDVRRVIELGQNLGARVDPASTDEVLGLLASLRGTAQQAEQAVDGVRRFATPAAGESVEDRLARVAKVLARILLTLVEVDRRLDEFATRLAEVRGAARQSRARTSNYITLWSVVCYGLLAWVAAGQVALCHWGWSHCRRGRLPTGQGMG